MRELLLTLVLLFVFLFPHTLRQVYGQLLTGLPGIVRLTYIYPDNKLFVDSIVVYNPYLIIKADEAKNNRPEFNPKQFASSYILSPRRL
ncbi:hypothetical protein SNE25_04985 [Mucilaginibacter sabulilitoris]|uniref:Uncharacterized protein n=1 Tax=Mucilaginibacter sabulilitoris TaxID=1173583 RepID=A0ABZ0TP64_9SPHI|nr:hypothetical protein [Mucilaginibacter sabulilitoris]WPU94873.1 hypothetical protein SNE25_04985 [Mucilaginibacter sabulilitoris]